MTLDEELLVDVPVYLIKKLPDGTSTDLYLGKVCNPEGPLCLRYIGGRWFLKRRERSLANVTVGKERTLTYEEVALMAKKLQIKEKKLLDVRAITVSVLEGKRTRRFTLVARNSEWIFALQALGVAPADVTADKIQPVVVQPSKSSVTSRKSSGPGSQRSNLQASEHVIETVDEAMSHPQRSDPQDEPRESSVAQESPKPSLKNPADVESPRNRVSRTFANGLRYMVSYEPGVRPQQKLNGKQTAWISAGDSKRSRSSRSVVFVEQVNVDSAEKAEDTARASLQSIGGGPLAYFGPEEQPELNLPIGQVAGSLVSPNDQSPSTAVSPSVAENVDPTSSPSVHPSPSSPRRRIRKSSFNIAHRQPDRPNFAPVLPSTSARNEAYTETYRPSRSSRCCSCMGSFFVWIILLALFGFATFRVTSHLAMGGKFSIRDAQDQPVTFLDFMTKWKLPFSKRLQETHESPLDWLSSGWNSLTGSVESLAVSMTPRRLEELSEIDMIVADLAKANSDGSLTEALLEDLGEEKLTKELLDEARDLMEAELESRTAPSSGRRLEEQDVLKALTTLSDEDLQQIFRLVE